MKLSKEQARQVVRLVLVAEVESRASEKDWALARRLAEAFDMPVPPREPWSSTAAVQYYWSDNDGDDE